jgi:hypothetical protein
MAKSGRASNTPPKKPARKKKASVASLASGMIQFADKTTKPFSALLHDAEGLQGVAVPVTYTLEKSSDVAFLSLSIGLVHIDLDADQDPSNPDSFATRNRKKYVCLQEDDGIRVTARAKGKAGGKWSLNVTISGTALGDNPIEESTDGNGRLDHDAMQS